MGSAHLPDLYDGRRLVAGVDGCAIRGRSPQTAPLPRNRVLPMNRFNDRGWALNRWRPAQTDRGRAASMPFRTLKPLWAVWRPITRSGYCTSPKRVVQYLYFFSAWSVQGLGPA